MNKLTQALASEMLKITAREFKDDFHNIKDVRIFWHDLTLLFFSEITCKQLSLQGKPCTLRNLSEMNLIPDDLIALEEKHTPSLFNSIFQTELTTLSSLNLALLRENLLGIDLCITKNLLELKQGKVARDTTGSYYTPPSLAKAVIEKAFNELSCPQLLQKEKNALKIADFSCGGGEFFNAIQEYLLQKFDIPHTVSATYFWGTDVDPIIILITVGHLLAQADYSDWKNIASHFYHCNPLVSPHAESMLRRTRTKLKGHLTKEGYL